MLLRYLSRHLTVLYLLQELNVQVLPDHQVSLVDGIRGRLDGLRHLFIVEFEVCVSKVVFGRGIIDKVDHIIENLFNLLLECVDNDLCVSENSGHLLFIREVCEGRSTHLHGGDDAVDHVRELGEHEGDLQTVTVLEKILHILKLGEIETSLR